LAARLSNQVIEDEFRLTQTKMNISDLIIDDKIKTTNKNNSSTKKKRSFGGLSPQRSRDSNNSK